MIKVAWNETFAHSLPPGHRFPMIKYELLPEQLIYEGTLAKENFFSPGIVGEKPILAVHDSEYWRRLQNLEFSYREQRTSGFPHSKNLIIRERSIAQGTMDCTKHASETGISFNVAGGTHHAFTNRSEGFCLLNDQAIAAQYLLDNKKCKRILIVDLDVHQGNGTAEIFADEKRVFTFSIHGRNNYPLKKMKSDLDVEMEDGTGDEKYLEVLAYNLMKLLKDFQPDFAFYQSGVDILKSDKLGRMNITIDGCKKRDEIVLQAFHMRNIPLVCCMGGGYSKDIRKIVEAHSNTFRMGVDLYS